MGLVRNSCHLDLFGKIQVYLSFSPRGGGGGGLSLVLALMPLIDFNYLAVAIKVVL